MIKGKHIFITGGAGFISNTLISRLISKNKITIYDNFARDTFSKSQHSGNEQIKVIKGDVLDYELLESSFNDVDLVVHAAAIAGIDTVIKDPVKTMEVNMIGTANVLKVSQKKGITDRFLDFSTSEVFGSLALNSKEEDLTVTGSAGEARWVYAVSKLSGEHLVKAYHTQHNLPTVTVRPFNVYGPGQTGEGAIQIFIKKALRGEDIYIHGEGNQIRAWCYVDDFVNCMIHCLDSPKAIGQTYNIGNARAVITILGLAQTVCRVLDSSSKIIFKPALSADIALRVPSVEKIMEDFNFRAQVDLEEGIQKTAEYFKNDLKA